MVMGKLGGGSGVEYLWLCSQKTPDTYIDSNICANLSQHALTNFQSGIIVYLALHCPFVSISPLHLLTGFIHHPPLLFNPCICFFSWPVRFALYIYIYSAQLPILFMTLCSHRHLWLWLKELCLMISLCARVSQQGYFAMLMNCLHGL